MMLVEIRGFIDEKKKFQERDSWELSRLVLYVRQAAILII